MVGPGVGSIDADAVPADFVGWLSDEDLSILALEDETVAGHTCKVILTYEQIDPVRLRDSIGARLEAAPVLQMRLAELEGRRCWVLDRDLDIDAHVVVDDHRDPVDPASLCAAVARIFERRLDRSRPLWQIDVLPRVAVGGSALIWRVHHAVADGTTVMRAAAAALWDENPSAVSGRAAVAHAAARGPLAVRPHRLASVEAMVREAPRPWQRSPFSGHIGARRSVAFASVELDALRRAARSADGATVNDAVLTVVAGGLRRWMESTHGRLGKVRVKVPVSLHDSPPADGQAGNVGNRDSFFCLELPLHPADPLGRLRSVHRATRIRKQEHDAQQVDALMRRLVDVPSLRHFAEQILAHPRSFALNVSNVPGPRHVVCITGSPVVALYSLAEIRAQHALRIAVVSLADTLNFGITADPTLLTDVDRLADYVRDDAAELVAAASAA